ncbi:MAG: CPXCG motif-containing cysteine-rich protein [Vulcanimicrobiota bacterium]
MFFTCPHCWEQVSILVDVSRDGAHKFVEDCEVCCNPLDFEVVVLSHSVTSIQTEAAQ